MKCSGGVLRRNDFTYVLDSNAMPYTSAVTTTIDVGTACQMVTKTEQTLDVYGNATQTRAFALNSLVTPVKTINCTYYNPVVNPVQMRNRLSTCSATQAGETRGMVALSYDGPLAGWTNGPVTQQAAPNEGGVYNLLNSKDKKELYPGDRAHTIDFSLPDHEAPLGEGWHQVEGVFGQSLSLDRRPHDGALNQPARRPTAVAHPRLCACGSG